MIPADFIYNLTPELTNNSFATAKAIPKGVYKIRFISSATGKAQEYPARGEVKYHWQNESTKTMRRLLIIGLTILLLPATTFATVGFTAHITESGTKNLLRRLKLFLFQLMVLKKRGP